MSQGIDFVVTKSLLCKADMRSVSRFIEEVRLPLVGNDDRLREVTDRLDFLERDALFAPIILEEFASLGLRLVNRFPSREIANETATFVDHVYDLAARERGGHEPTHFDGDWIRCAFILTATTTVVSKLGADPYVRAVDWSIRNAYPRVYLVARGHHVSVAREVGDLASRDSRVLGVRECVGTVPGLGGEEKQRLVTCISVDVREYVSIGQRPIVAVGPRHERRISRAKAQRSGSRR